MCYYDFKFTIWLKKMCVSNLKTKNEDLSPVVVYFQAPQPHTKAVKFSEKTFIYLK